MMLKSQKWVRKIAKELLQQPCDAVDIMVEVLGVAEV